MRLYREGLRGRGVITAEEMKRSANGRMVRVAGCVICRQRPGTAKGFMFLSIEDETGIANVIVEPDMVDEYRKVLLTSPYLLVVGIFAESEWGHLAEVSVGGRDWLLIRWLRCRHDFR